MKIAIDASCLQINPYSGLSEVVQNLISELPFVENGNNFIWFYNYFRCKNQVSKNFLHKSDKHSLRIPRRLINWLWKFDRSYFDFLLPKVDIYHSLHVQIPASVKLKKVLTVHDCRYLANPYLYPKRAVNRYRELMTISLNRANMVVAVSNFTREELLTHFSISENRIKVIYNGFRPCCLDSTEIKEKLKYLIKKHNLPNSYLLFIGVLEPRKNLVRLIEALSILQKEINDIPNLVIVGTSVKQWAKSDEAKKAAYLGVLKHIHVVGMVEKKELYFIIKKSLGLCYPSLYEGFGFPPLEAMSLGVPVLAGRYSATQEVTGNAACMVDPINVNDIVRGLDKVIFDNEYRQKLIERGFKQIKNFSWRKAAEEYISLYKEVISS